MDDDKIEELAKAFHETYFGYFWDSAQREGGVTREFDPERDSWKNFGESHKEALRKTLKELVERNLISIGG